MKTIKLLDCTLRDGGRLFDCKFNDYEIAEICNRLSKSNINIIEIGFIRDPTNVSYLKNSTFFTNIEQANKFVPDNTDTEFVAFVDYGMFNLDTLPPCSGKGVTGLRVGFTKKNYDTDKENVLKTLKDVKSRGYRLYVQGVNSLGYTEAQYAEVIDMINELHPYSFGIVDTYGAMYPSDVERLYRLVDQRLDKDIALDFHAHNNKQLAFANSIIITKLCAESRTLIIDGTLEGMGKCAGNLNIELMACYLNDEFNYGYDYDEILDTIDEFIKPLKSKYQWGYSIPSLMGGLYESHPNNIIYLSNKYRLSFKDYKNIISMISPDIRQRYDYENLERLYWEYSDMKIDDSQAIETIRQKYHDKKVLVKSPGHSLIEYHDELEAFIKEKQPEIITVGFIEPGTVCFTSNKRRYEKILKNKSEGMIITSNICVDDCGALVINYNSLVDRRYPLYDNSVIMLLNLLKKVKVSEIYLAGFDGYKENKNNYVDDSFADNKKKNCDVINKEISMMLTDFREKVEPEIKFVMLTPSEYVIGD